MDLHEGLRKKLTTKEAFDEVLVAASPLNARIIGKPGPRDEQGRRTGPDQFYNAWFEMYMRNTNQIWNVQPWVTDGHYARRQLHMLLGERQRARFHPTRWWMLRETLRFVLGVYGASTILAKINVDFPELMVHTKPDDPDKLAVFYTPDVASGERDFQLKTTLGKFLRKYYPQVPDDDIRDVEAAFRADVLAILEILPPEEIVPLYASGLVKSCMAYKAENWGLRVKGSQELVHPCEIYNAPGFGVAVWRDAAQAVKARSLVWVNPDDPTDKRYVRVYGDPALTSMLTRNGYRHRGLAGARFKRIHLHSHGGVTVADPNLVVAAYIDNVASSDHVTAFIYDEDPRYLRAIDRDTLAAFHKMRLNLNAGVGAVMVTIDPGATLDKLQVVCPITRERFMVRDGVLAWLDGKEGFIHKKAAAHVESVGWVKLAMLGEEWTPGCQPDVVLAPPDTPKFTHPSVRQCDDTVGWLDNEKTRVKLGFYLPMKRYYPEIGWLYGHQTALVPVRAYHDDNGKLVLWGDDADEEDQLKGGSNLILKQEMAWIITKPNWNADSGDTSDEESEEKPKALSVHISEVNKYPKRYKRVSQYLSALTVVDTRCVEIVRTATSNRQVVPHVHAVKQRIDGKWDILSNLRRNRRYGLDYYTERDTGNTGTIENAGVFRYVYERAVADIKSNYDYMMSEVTPVEIYRCRLKVRGTTPSVVKAKLAEAWTHVETPIHRTLESRLYTAHKQDVDEESEENANPFQGYVFEHVYVGYLRSNSHPTVVRARKLLELWDSLSDDGKEALEKHLAQVTWTGSPAVFRMQMSLYKFSRGLWENLMQMVTEQLTVEQPTASEAVNNEGAEQVELLAA